MGVVRSRPPPLLQVNARQVTFYDIMPHTFRSRLPGPLAPKILTFVADLIQEWARCTYLNYWSHSGLNAKLLEQWNRGCFVSIFGTTDTVGHAISGHCGWGNEGQRCSVHTLPWSTNEWTQAVYTLPHTLCERWLVARMDRSFPNFRQFIQHLTAMALSKPPPAHSMSTR